MISEIPPRGAYVIDTRTDRVGQVMDHTGDFVHLRPPGGGKEWECPVTSLQITTLRAYLRAHVTDVNNHRRFIR